VSAGAATGQGAGCWIPQISHVAHSLLAVMSSLLAAAVEYRRRRRPGLRPETPATEY